MRRTALQRCVDELIAGYIRWLDKEIERKREEMTFKRKVELWLAAHDLGAEVLEDKRVQMALKGGDVFGLVDDIIKVGGHTYYVKLDNPKSKMELAAFVGN